MAKENAGRDGGGDVSHLNTSHHSKKGWEIKKSYYNEVAMYSNRLFISTTQ